MVRQARFGEVRHGPARFGKAWQAGFGKFRLVAVRKGVARCGRQGEVGWGVARSGAVRFGEVWQAWQVRVR